MATTAKKPVRKTTAKRQPSKRPVAKKTATKKSPNRQEKWQIPAHVWYESLGVIAILLAIIGGFQFGSIGANIFGWVVLVFGLLTPIVFIGIALLGSLCIWYQERLKPSWHWLVAGLIPLALLVVLSSVIQPNQRDSEFVSAISRVRLGDWGALIATRGGLIGNQIFTLSHQFIGTFGTFLVASMTIVLASFFWRQKSLADSLQTTVQHTKVSVAKAQKQFDQWQHKQAEKKIETGTIYDIEAQTPAIHNQGILFPDEVFEQLAPEPIPEFESQGIELELHIAKNEPQSPASEPEIVDELTFERPVASDLPYQLPPIQLLADVPATDLSQMKATITTNVERLQQIFASFKIGVTISAVNVGPAITQYEVQPDPGIKVSRIVNLSDDIALGLAAKDVRIVAPIPGKAAIGIEVPNLVVAMVSLKQTLDTTLNDLDDKLLVALGKDISGNTITARLDKMPHLLVAGSTGSGKSVCINGIITSILMRATPEEVKLLLIDPKKVELSYFNHIPHLLAPVVTDAKKAAFALRKIVKEMEDRYDAFATVGVRNIEGYNAQSDEAMPFIVVIIDELADLMLVASKDVEESIMRITQMARAAGIHLIVATQRPSVDVITGVIKANIPSRIAFAVSSQIDSRTILDMGGAEALVGKGDMLFFPSGESKPLRVQGAFVSEQEVIRVVDFIKAQQQTIHYHEALLSIESAQSNELERSEEEVQSDILLPEVLAFVIEQQKASTSLIQRRFKIGYNRAARLMEMMEAQGIIGPNEGTKPRAVLKTSATYPETASE